MTYIRFVDVHKAFAGKPVLTGMNLDVAKGEVLFIIGTSGVGKSVTIKLLVGLLELDGLAIQPIYRPAANVAPIAGRAAAASSSAARENSCGMPWA